MENLNIRERNKGNCIVLEMEGILNSYTFNDFQNKVLEKIEKNDVCLDMGGVETLSSAGIGVLMNAMEKGSETGKKLFILKPSYEVEEAIKSTGFIEMFRLLKSEAEIG